MARLASPTKWIGGDGGRRLARPEKVADPFYATSEWRALSGAVKAARNWVCDDCGGDFATNRRALIGDHVIEIKDGGAPLDPHNVACRCTACHNRKTAREAARRGRG